ncbi:Na+/H+ antiporter NhaC family protein [Flavobacterium turcicum]|uniref:Na+/H+ antiporter NhaC family protein n=1 Tax=Flavobacterium turcicum TaxID=2764718 RepID=A0ABR7JEN3_9FLAO|nr:Na+/H+ antiporter NhaC family protein [Flavobacterium turcicum]MBC5862967.1 Na+/H+ antiporter NhaC family protein [Flavobacterium turcicum]NHL01699.1 Na+/H+ antiporter NhaC family protein [Flavobacterium turcicum]
MTNFTKESGNPYALIPLFIFIFTFLGAGILLDDFYAFPSPVAVLVGIIAAFILFKTSTDDKVDTLIAGCGDSKIMTMCLIYLFAGAFAVVSKAMGGVDAVVNLGISTIDVAYFPLGIFLIASFLSTATGTSVGAIVAIGPIAISLADKSGASMPLIAGALLGGSMLGDNLSMISDTTIAATQSLGCDLKDKFKINLFIALPAAIVTILIFFYLGFNSDVVAVDIAKNDYSLWAILPYVLVIVFAVVGVNVFYTLLLGTIIAGLIGFYNDSFTVMEFTQKIYEGFTSMTDIFLLSMLTGGLAAMVDKAGGITWVLNQIKKRIKSKKSAQTGIGVLVGFANLAIANNTVSIVITGPIAKEINDEYGLSAKKSATILDIFSCVIQGILPYGAQILLILSYANGKLDFLDILSNAWYHLFLLVFTLIAIYATFWDKLAYRFLKV